MNAGGRRRRTGAAAAGLLCMSLVGGPVPGMPPASAAGTFTVPAYAGTYADAGGVAPLYPSGGDADDAGNRYLVDSGGDRVVRVAPDGTMSQVLKTGLDKPRALALDPDPSKLWVADTRDNQILQISTSGQILHTFGGAGYVKSPFGIAADPTGVYVADTYDYRIIKIDPSDGHRIWAQGSCVGQTIARPRGVTIGSDGDVYAADTDHGRIVVLDPTTGSCLRAFGSSGSGNGQFAGPRDLVSDGAGGLWVAEAKSARIQHITDAGVFISKAGSYGSGPGKFRAPACVFMDGGIVDVCDTYEFVLQRFSVSSSGAASYLDSVGGVRPTLGGFNQPFGVAYSAGGDLYVTDMFNQRGQKRAAAGTWSEWGGFGGRSGAMQFPRGIAVAPDGTVVLTDSENDRIDLFSPNLAFLKSIRPSGTAFGWPHQTALAPDGTYWVADTNKNRVLHLSASGSVLANFSGGGQIKTPSGIALDANGDVYVANRGASTVQKYTPGGSLLATLATPGSGATNVRTPWNLTMIGSVGSQVLLIADGGNGRILALSPNGAPLGSFGSSGSGPGQLLDPRCVAWDPVDGTLAVADFGNNRISLWR